MQLLTDARQKLKACSHAAQSPLSSLEQKGRELERQLKAMSAQAAPRIAAVRQRSLAFTTQLDTKAARTRAALERPFGGASAGALSALDALKVQAGAQARGFEAAAASLEGLGSALDDGLGAAADELSRALALIESVGAEIVRAEGRGLGVLAGAEKAVEALERQLLERLSQIETPLLEVIDALSAAANLFVDGIRAKVRDVRSSITSATSLAVAGADGLSQLVMQLETKASAVIKQVESLVSLVTGAIDQIPVKALPEPMAKPAVSALTQVATQFSTQLQTGAQAASSQLKAVSGQISTAIEQGQQQVSEQLDAALKPLFAQIDTLLAQVDAERQRIEDAVKTQLKQVEAQKNELLDDAKRQLDALTAPVSREIESLCALVEQTASDAASSVNEALTASRAGLTSLQAQLGTFLEEATGLDTRLTAAEAQLSRALAGVIALAGRVP